MHAFTLCLNDDFTLPSPSDRRRIPSEVEAEFVRVVHVDAEDEEELLTPRVGRPCKNLKIIFRQIFTHNFIIF